jgi:PAS domain S-box-containing protein
MAANILVVDDEGSIRELSRQILKTQGYRCHTASNASHARELLKKDHFDLILSDVNMPGESGLDFLKFVLTQYPRTAVIVVSIMGDPEVAESALNMGVYGYLLKPFTPNEMLLQVANALHRRRLESENRRYREHLEQLVDERTRALQETIQDLEHVQSDLRESETKFRSLFESSRDVVYIAAKDGAIHLMNASGLELFRYNEEELQALNMAQLYRDPTDRSRIHEWIRKHGFVKDWEVDLQRKDGSIIKALITSSVRKDEAGRIIGYQGIIRDVTERKQMENELIRANEDNERLIAAISSILIGLSASQRVTKWNERAEETFSIARSLVLGRSFRQCGIEWEWERIEKGIGACQQHKELVRLDNVRYLRPDGTDGILGLTLTPIFGRDADFQGLLLLGADITERKLLESQLTQAQKLESVGRLAAGIAHEINTPIQYVGDNTRFLQDAFKDLNDLLLKYSEFLRAVREDAGTEEAIEEMEMAVEEADLSYLLEEIPHAIQQTLEGVERVAGIVTAMKAFSHPGGEKKIATDLNKAIESTITVSRNEWKYVADVVTDLDPTLPLISCLPGEFNQAILNILVNAAHAIGDVVADGKSSKGRITVRTRRNETWAEISISDTGPGIPAELRSKVFDPFFTTKEVGKGTGQGLAICHSVIVEKHNGTITCRSEIGSGTTFTILLPVDGASSSENVAS